MKAPEIPENEEARLKALRSLGILDTPSELRFDRLTRLAKRLFDVPIALVSLVDEDRQWFKSCIGLDVRETSRELSFCGHAILGEEILVVEDATKDARFVDNNLVTNAPGIRFYAGCPLRFLDGSKLGTLCIIDIKPRTLVNEDFEAFKDLAEMVERELVAVQLASLDELTGISNRRGFLSLAHNALGICSRLEIPAVLVYFDLNDFKSVNDNFGHIEGDRALATFASHMKDTFRNSDVYARLGGDEFVVLFTDTLMKRAEEVIARFRESIDLYNIEANNGYNITFSAGIVAVDHLLDHSIEALLSRADYLMYEKKQREHRFTPKLMHEARQNKIPKP